MKIGILGFGPPKLVSKSMVVKPIAMAALERGHRVLLITERDLTFDFGRDQKILFKNKPFPELDALIVRAGFLKDISVHTSVIKQMQLQGLTVIGGYMGTHRCKNKLRMMQLLDYHGFPIPKTRVVFDYNLIGHIADEFTFPVILKTITGSLGKGVMIAETKRGLIPIVEHLISSTSLPVMIQEFVKEAKGADIRVFVVGKKIVAAMERKAKKGEFRSNFSIGGKVRVMDLTEEEKDLAIRSAIQLGVHVAGVDIIRTNEGPKLLEVNANPGVEGITQATGINVSAEIIKYVERKVNRKSKGKVNKEIKSEVAVKPKVKLKKKINGKTEVKKKNGNGAVKKKAKLIKKED